MSSEDSHTSQKLMVKCVFRKIERSSEGFVRDTCGFHGNMSICTGCVSFTWKIERFEVRNATRQVYLDARGVKSRPLTLSIGALRLIHIRM